MQAAVPFTWEERPGKPKQRPRKLQCSSNLQPCASTGDYDFRNPDKMFSLQELFSKDSIRSSGSTSNKESFCLTPPPRLRYASGMSSSSSSSQSRSFSTPTCSPEADDDEDCSKKCKQEVGKHARTRSVTLLDLIRTGNRDEIEPCHSRRDHCPGQGEKTLGELFKSDTRKENNKGLPVRHKAGSDSFVGSARTRRSSYLPYKQGLLSIFCMSPYKNGLLRCASPAARKYR